MKILLCHYQSANWYRCSGRQSGRNEDVKDVDPPTSSSSPGYVLQRVIRSIRNHAQDIHCNSIVKMRSWGHPRYLSLVKYLGASCAPQQWNYELAVHAAALTGHKISIEQRNKKILRLLLLCKFKTSAQNSSMYFTRTHTHPRVHFRHITVGVLCWRGNGM